MPARPPATARPDGPCDGEALLLSWEDQSHDPVDGLRGAAHASRPAWTRSTDHQLLNDSWMPPARPAVRVLSSNASACVARLHGSERPGHVRHGQPRRGGSEHFNGKVV
jgi:hypothetical protein